MVITCPSCSARYRLNPEKIQGRGAKITCPKCSHVFVVFTDGGEARSSSAAVSQPRVKTQSRPASPLEEPSRNAATTTGAFKAVGIEEASAPPKKTNTDANIRIVAPGSRSTRRIRTVDTGEMTVPPPSPAPAPAAAGSPADVEDMVIGSASDLDFRSVGIKTWKVKVAIGLIYDFSDIATLKKYLADKKVTPDDLISQNNKDWIRIGDIGDLDQHFIDAWKAAKAAVDSGQVAIPEKKASGTGSQSTLGHQSATMNAVGQNTGSFRTGDTGSPRALSTGAYGAAVDPPKRRRQKAHPVEEPPKRPRGLILAGVLIVGLVLVWRMMPSDAPDRLEDTAPIPVSEIKPSDAELQKIREGIQNKLKEEHDRIVAEAALGAQDEVPGEDGAGGADAAESRRIAVPPSEQRFTVQSSGDIRDPIVQPPPKGQYQRPRYVSPTPTPAPGSEGDVVVVDQVDPAKLYYDNGQKKLKAGDYGQAQKMFSQATKKNDACGKCWAGLAEAEKQLGHAAEAAAAASKAAELGTPTTSLASP